MPITFGSVGDIIAICLLIKDCVEALSDATGAAATYRAVVRELDFLERALLEVDLLARTHDITTELSALFESAKATIKECQNSLQTFKARMKRFGPHFDNSANRSTANRIFKGPAMKLLWQVSVKDELSRFRAEVVAYSISINQLLATASMHIEKANQERLQAGIQESHSQTMNALRNQDRKLKEIRRRLKDVNRRISDGQGTVIKVLQSQSQWLNQLGKDLKNLMTKIIIVNAATYKLVLDIKRQLPAVNQLQTSMSNERLFYLEDALGRVFPITLQFVNSWDALHSVLETHFRGMQGMNKVVRKEYALEDRATGKDVELSNKYERVFLPGKWVLMSIIFMESTNVEQQGNAPDTCPGCQAKSLTLKPGLEVKCSVCNLVYTRKVEENEAMADNEMSNSNMAHVLAPEPLRSDVQLSLQTQRLNIKASSPFGSKERHNDCEESESPSDFTRVRMIAKIRRLRQQVSNSEAERPKHEIEDVVTVDESAPPKRNRSTLQKKHDEIQSKNVKEDKKFGMGSAERRDFSQREPVQLADKKQKSSKKDRSKSANKAKPISGLAKEYARSSRYTPPPPPSPYLPEYMPRTPKIHTPPPPPEFSLGHMPNMANKFYSLPPTYTPRRYDSPEHMFRVGVEPRPVPARRNSISSRDRVHGFADIGFGDHIPTNDYDTPKYSALVCHSCKALCTEVTPIRQFRRGSVRHNPSSRPVMIPMPPLLATEADRLREGIPAGYSLKNWSPDEVPLLLLGSAFDAGSLGNWIYDWTVFAHGSASPFAELAEELWLLLVELAGKLKRCEEVMPQIRYLVDRELVDDFFEAGDRLWIRFTKLLKVCEQSMLENVIKETKRRTATSSQTGAKGKQNEKREVKEKKTAPTDASRVEADSKRNGASVQKVVDLTNVASKGSSDGEACPAEKKVDDNKKVEGKKKARDAKELSSKHKIGEQDKSSAKRQSNNQTKVGKRKPGMGQDAGVEFVNTLFGRDCELEKTEKLIGVMRLWNMRFDRNCEGILRYPSAP